MTSSASGSSLPAFRSVDEEVSLTRPLSGWAVLSLAVGLSCLVVPVSVKLIPLSILAILVGLIVTLRLSRPDADSGRWMSTFCLGMGLASAVWCVTASKSRTQYLSDQAAVFAKEYLQVLASGQLYNAIELRLPFVQRQSADVDLAAFYETYQGEVQLDIDAKDAMRKLGGSETEDPAKVRKTAVERMKIDPVTIYAQKFPDAQWDVVGIKSIGDNGTTSAVKVIMQVQGDPNTQVLVEMMRNYVDSTAVGAYAEWRVGNQEIGIAQ